MSRRIRRGRRGIDLPLKNPPASTDRVIGHDASGNMHQFLVDALGGDFDIGALPNRPGNLANSDRFPLQTSAGVDYRTTLAGIIAGMVTNITAAQINELLKREVRIYVDNTGAVTNHPNRLPITCSRSGNVFTLTCPVGYVWHSGVGAGHHPTQARTINVSDGFGSRNLAVYPMNQAGNPTAISFYFHGTLI